MMRYLILLLFLTLFLSACENIKHVIQITEPTDHTQGDDGGKIQYKIIFGDKSQKE